jgi:putative lumazine-binding protein
MKRSVFLALAVLLIAGAAAAQDPDEAAIIAAVDHAYVHGVHIDADAQMMRDGMDPSFVMFVLTDKGVTQVTRDQWIERLTASKKPDAPKPNVKANIKVLDRSVNTAVAKVDLFRDGKQLFTDYILLYKLPEGWKLVGKAFQRH